jgi:energy-coupling factor transporter ATP-binding protein EcfA2
MPIHGAMVRITMKTGKKANIILVGDSGAGKSESLEALRMLSGENLREMKIIFDDMGSLEIGKDGKIKAYGTEIGAFVRIDDLDTGYVYGQLDRMIIMIPNREPNARIIIPVTTLKEIQHGWNIDYFLYANNYEKPEDENYLQRFKTPEEAMAVFKEGKRLAKGTTQETGISTTYYANIFGPLQLKEEHEIIAEKYFKQMFKEGIYVGQIKTQLGLQGMELEGPKKAAIALFKEIMKNKNQNL